MDRHTATAQRATHAYLMRHGMRLFIFHLHLSHNRAMELERYGRNGNRAGLRHVMNLFTMCEGEELQGPHDVNASHVNAVHLSVCLSVGGVRRVLLRDP